MSRKPSPILLALQEIRDEIRGTNARVDMLTERVDGLTTRVDRVERRVVESETRLGTAVLGMTVILQDVRDLLRDRRDDRDRVADHEIRIRAIEQKVGA